MTSRSGITINIGYTYTHSFSWTASGAPVNLSGWVASMRLRDRESAVVATLSSGGSADGSLVLDEDDGRVDVSIPHAVTARFLKGKGSYEVELRRSSDGYLKPLIAGDVQYTTRAPEFESLSTAVNRTPQIRVIEALDIAETHLVTRGPPGPRGSDGAAGPPGADGADGQGGSTLRTEPGTVLTQRTYLTAQGFDIEDNSSDDAIVIRRRRRMPRCSVATVSTANIPDLDNVSSAVINGINCNGQLILLWAQTDTTQNGIAVMHGPYGGTYRITRRTVFDQLFVDGRFYVWVRSGTQFGDTVRMCTSKTTFVASNKGVIDSWSRLRLSDFIAEGETTHSNAFHRAQFAAAEGGKVIIDESQGVLTSTEPWRIVANASIEGLGTELNTATRINFQACAGIVAIKAIPLRRDCRLVGLANVTLSGAQTLDGTATANGDRVLLTAQTNPAENWIWTVNHSGAWTRAADSDVKSEIPLGARVAVTAGATKSGTSWHNNTDAEASAFVLGTDAITVTERTPDYTDGYELAGSSCVLITGLAVFHSGANTTADDNRHGINLERSARIEHCYVNNFPANGIHVSASHSRVPPTSGNIGEIANTTVYGNGMSGIFLDGADGNAIKIIGCNATLNGVRSILDRDFGFNDDSFLGNCFLGCHAASNNGAYRSVGVSARTAVLGCYAENDNGSALGGDCVQVNSRTGPRPGYEAVSTQLGMNGGSNGLALSNFTRESTIGGIGARQIWGTTSYLWRFQTTTAEDTSGYQFLPESSSLCWSFMQGGLSTRRVLAFTMGGSTFSHSQIWLNLGVIIGSYKFHSGLFADRPTGHSTATGSVNNLTGYWNVGGNFFAADAYAGLTPILSQVSARDGSNVLSWSQGIYFPVTGTLVAQTASVAAFNLYATTPPAGDYEVQVFLNTTTAGSAGTVLATVAYTDITGATSEATPTLSLASTGRLKATFRVETAGSAQMTLATTVAGAADNPQYRVRWTARRVA